MGTRWKVSSLHLRRASHISFRPGWVTSTNLRSPHPNGTQGGHWTHLCFELDFHPAQRRRGKGRLSSQGSKGLLQSSRFESSSHTLTPATNPTWLQFEKTPHPIWWFRLSDWRALRRSAVLSQNRPAVGKRGASAVTWNKSTWWLHLQWAGVDFKLRGPIGPPQGPGHTTHPFQGCFLSSEIKGLSFVIPTCRDHSNRR